MAAEKKTILLVDDHDVLYRSGTERVLNPAKRHSEEPIVKCEYPWEGEIAWNSVYRDPKTGKYQAWYQCFAGPRAKEKTHRCTVGYAESNDGIHWSKPLLGLFSFNGIEKTNIVLIANGGFSDRYSNCVIYDPLEKNPDHRYKMGYNDFATTEGKTNPGLCVAFSPDGIHWKKYSNVPIQPTSYGDFGNQPPYPGEKGRKYWDVPISMSDVVDVFYDPVRQVFAYYGKMWIDSPSGGMYFKHAMGRTESKDFIHWTEPQLVLAPDDQDPPYVEFHTSPVFYYNGRYFCLNQILNRSVANGVIDIELMVSRDGLQWDRPFRNQHFISRGKPGAYDSGSIYTNSTPAILDDEIRFYYGAYSGGAIVETPNVVSGVGFSSIPIDRFAGIKPLARVESPTLSKPLENIGQVTLKPIDLQGYDKMTVNADASEGSIRVELLDARGRRVHRFTAEDALPITGDSLSHKVQWKDAKLSDLQQGKYMVRLHLEKATVYAVTIK